MLAELGQQIFDACNEFVDARRECGIQRGEFSQAGFFEGFVPHQHRSGSAHGVEQGDGERIAWVFAAFGQKLVMRDAPFARLLVAGPLNTIC